MIDSLKKWFLDNKKQILEDYFAFLRFKTISADHSKMDEMIKCSNWLENYLKEIGLQTEIIKTPTFPIVFAKNQPREEKSTLLIYGHYDVMPVDPIHEWLSDPFEPIIKEDHVYARGASDNKGQIFYTLVALKGLKELGIELDFNIKITIEGEEEATSKGFYQTIESIKDKIKADFLLVVDFNIPEINTPAITLGLRGMSALTCEFTGSHIDLHSGEHGGFAYNPLRAAAEVLSKLYNANGKVLVDGFYDDVEELTVEDKKLYDLEFDEDRYKKTFGLKAFAGEKNFSPIESNWIRPTLEINGIGGGYFEKGFKTVIPAKVTVKISSRLVPNQKPEKIFQLLKDFLEKKSPKEIDIKIEAEGGGMAVRGDSTSLLAKAAENAYTEVFGKPCKKILAGGSVPIVGEIVSKLNCNVVMMGMALADDNFHAPNEHFGVDRFEKGFLTVAKLLKNFDTGK